MVDFVLVAGILTLLTLSVMQLGLALHVRNTVHDAASEGARAAALADSDLERGAARTSELIRGALGPGYDHTVRAEAGVWGDVPIAVVHVSAPFPVLGLLGVPGGVKVTGRAVVESID